VQCESFPLAQKVIGSLLHSEPYLMLWDSAKKKLLNGESISNYRKEGLFRCFLIEDINFGRQATKKPFFVII